ncbi:MAG: histidinol-phosphate transaminase [Candidatus Omnitrophota bacterium]|nr:histidinol-phosphate transaminase [Candidatus Omnitrophota bacterium]
MALLSHGGDLKSFAERYGLREDEIRDFSSNRNPLGLPDTVEKLFPHLLKDLGRHPDPEARDLRCEIARKYPLWPENVIAGNGSIAILLLALRTLGSRRALLIEPCFSEYRRLLNQVGAEIHSVPLKESEGFGFSVSRIINAMRGVDLLILGHPNNPTGTALSRAELLEVISEARRLSVFVIIDEAFVDWCPELSIAQEVKDNSYFLILRSMTKFYSLPGIRAGYALGSRKLIEKMAYAQETWSCNRIAQRLAIEALRDQTFQSRSLEWFEKESKWFRSTIEQSSEYRIFPSWANFFLIKQKRSAERKGFFDDMGRSGIYLRELHLFPGLGHAYFRAALGLRSDNELLISRLEEWACQTSLAQSPTAAV